MSTEPHPGPCIDTDHPARLRALPGAGTSEAALAADLRQAWARRGRLEGRDLADHASGTPTGAEARELDRLRRDIDAMEAIIDERHLCWTDDDRRVCGCLVTVDPHDGSLVVHRGLPRADAGESRDRDARGTVPGGRLPVERGGAS